MRRPQDLEYREIVPRTPYTHARAGEITLMYIYTDDIQMYSYASMGVCMTVKTIQLSAYCLQRYIHMYTRTAPAALKKQSLLRRPDPRAQAAMAALKEMTSFLKIWKPKRGIHHNDSLRRLKHGVDSRAPPEGTNIGLVFKPMS